MNLSNLAALFKIQKRVMTMMTIKAMMTQGQTKWFSITHLAITKNRTLKIQCQQI